MQLIVFSKMLKQKSIAELIDLAQRHGYDGYDLAVRPGHPVNPDNAAAALPQAQAQMARAGLRIGMVTGNFDLLTADHPLAEPLLAAMDSADVRLLKLGYFKFEPETMDYWEQVESVRQALAAWEKLARVYNVKICYHTHSHYCMGLNARRADAPAARLRPLPTWARISTPATSRSTANRSTSAWRWRASI